MSTNGTAKITPSMIDSRLATELNNGNASESSDLDSPDQLGKRKYFNSPEITCSPSPCVFDWDKSRVREFTGELQRILFCNEI